MEKNVIKNRVEYEKKGVGYKMLVFLLVLSIIIIVFAIIYTFIYLSNYEVKEIDAKVLDNGFEMISYDMEGANFTFKIKRNSGIEDYQGFQVFMQDSYGKVKYENVFILINIGEEKTIAVNYANNLANVKFATLVPIT